MKNASLGFWEAQVGVQGEIPHRTLNDYARRRPTTFPSRCMLLGFGALAELASGEIGHLEPATQP
jgi:hypothetical protein